MDSRSNGTKPVLHRTTPIAWYAFGFWLQVVIVGLGMLATGVALLIDRPHAPSSAVVWLTIGGVLAALAWHRSRTALRRLHRAEETPERRESNDNWRTGNQLSGAMSDTLFPLSGSATVLKQPL